MRGMVGVAALCALLGGCGGEVSGDAPARDGGVADAPITVDASPAIDAAPVAPVVAFESPADGARFVRDTIEDESWLARVELVVRAEGVDHVDVIADDTIELATLRPPMLSAFASFAADGARVLTAIGRDAGGAELVRDEITIEVAAPADESCHAMLDALGLEWEPIASLRGVADPVRVQPTIAGVRYRSASQSMPTAMSMDCELAPRLVRLSELISTYGIDEVIHLGIYNYRCIGGGDPDSGTCTPSQHAYARAIDLHAFGLEGSDATYSTEDDFVITRRADTCPMMSSSEPDRVLKEIACALWSERVFQIVLTPNYNDAHRNHYHVDLTEGSMYLGSGVEGVDPIVGGLGD
ncbi:extensin family protein [Sandaracinus amylolyticus]|uniref:extensin family protein n=1 Tax=Sandaracinus amylolyticus TaxID=927083 RepID=UPI00069D7000|nr:extensin family protein [Sandaracinus amylolyticus]